MLILEWQITGRLAGNAMTMIVINLIITLPFRVSRMAPTSADWSAGY
jgi:hypothetical protein